MLNKKGFTLIEILISISIVSILATFVVMYSNTSFQKSRDTQRKSDLKNIADALEIFYNDHGVYPPSVNFSRITACPYNPSSPMNSTDCTWGSGNITDGETVYMSPIPIDPRSANNYRYIYLVSPTRDAFKLFTLLEYSGDPDINPDASNQGQDCIASGVLNRCNYAVSSPQTPINSVW